jgi:hypothetical protein
MNDQVAEIKELLTAQVKTMRGTGPERRVPASYRAKTRETNGLVVSTGFRVQDIGSLAHKEIFALRFISPKHQIHNHIKNLIAALTAFGADRPVYKYKFDQTADLGHSPHRQST